MSPQAGAPSRSADPDRRRSVPRAAPSPPAAGTPGGRLGASAGSDADAARRAEHGRYLLEELRRRLAADLEGLAAVGDDQGPCGGGFEDLVTAAQWATHHETDELLRYRLERRLAEIDSVRERLGSGTYGVCVTCGGDIPAERLEVMPEAVRCLPCRRAHERAQGFGRSPRRAA